MNDYNCVIGIDPGANGGIAVNAIGRVITAKMPKELVKLGDPDRILRVVEKWGGMEVNDKKDVPVGADEVTNLNAERK